MRIGLIVHSLSNHTLTVAEKLEACLVATGHSVTLAQVVTVGPATRATENAPSSRDAALRGWL